MSHSITIQWNASSGPISGYNIRRGTAAGNETSTPINASLITGTTYTDTTVYPGQVYSYEITAVYNGVESADSLSVVSTAVPFTPVPAAVTAAVNFGAASSFGILGATTVTNVPGTATTITGDVGVSPGTSITGFVTPASISGVFHNGDFVSAAAQGAALNVFNQCMALTPTTILGIADIGGHVYTSGIYSASSSLAITGVLVLDAQGNANATWFFQIPTTLTTAASNSYVVLLNGAQANNVFWLVGSSATLGTGTFFAGNVIASSSITTGTSAYVDGRLFALNGAVTLNVNEVITFQTGTLTTWTPTTSYVVGAIIFDGSKYQIATTSGVSGTSAPTWNHAAAGTTTDNSVVWTLLNTTGSVVLTYLPPSLPNVPPAPPAAPTGVTITSEM